MLPCIFGTALHGGNLSRVRNVSAQWMAQHKSVNFGSNVLRDVEEADAYVSLGMMFVID